MDRWMDRQIDRQIGKQSKASKEGGREGASPNHFCAWHGGTNCQELQLRVVALDTAVTQLIYRRYHTRSLHGSSGGGGGGGGDPCSRRSSPSSSSAGLLSLHLPTECLCGFHSQTTPQPPIAHESVEPTDGRSVMRMRRRMLCCC